MNLFGKIVRFGYDNSLDAFIPEFWANEGIMILENNMIAAAMVHRDFEPLVANYGDTVNTRKPSEFAGKRKTDADSVTIQDANATNIPVILNQWMHVSFMIKDGERSKSFKDLVAQYLQPAMLAGAQFIDQVTCTQVYQFLGNSVGSLGGMTSTNSKDYILDARQKMNDNKAWVTGRRFIWNSSSETNVLKNDSFTNADKVGDGGLAMREAEIGRKLGFDHYMDQNMPYIRPSVNTTGVAAVNNAGGYPAGTTVLVINGAGATAANFNVGSMVTIAGAPGVYTVTALSGGPPYTGMTITPALQAAVVHTAVITNNVPGAVNLVAGYTAGYAKDIAIDGFTVAPQAGQMLSFGSQPYLYGVLQATTTSVLLDRPLEASIANNDVVNLGPAGGYNWGFHKNALALVVRPLALPEQGTGAKAGLANYNGLSLRAVITYNGEKQGHLVTLDMLFGVKVLDTALGVVVLA